ncbi:MAG: hypothetical protein ACLP5E_23810, partial [Streptosporangiaceae bacterium]
PNLPATPEPSPIPRPRQPEADRRAPVPDAPGQPSLADHDRRRRWEWRMRRLLAEADHWMLTRVRHPDGGERTVTETRADEEEQRQQINRETDMGSRKHRRLPRWQGWIPKFVLAFDFALLLYFFAGITNVDWQSPVSISLGFAIILAGMVTVLAYGFLSFTGHRMRSYKNHAGTVHLDELDGFTKAAFGTAMAVITVLAALMYLRIRSEVIDALGSQAGVTALVIPLAVAVVSAVANYLVVLIHALDGSDEVARLGKLADATRRPIRKAHRLRARAAQQAQR